MVDFLHYTHRYVPTVSVEVFVPVLFSGDQLTRERAYHAQNAKLQSPTPIRKLVPKCEDWHAGTSVSVVENSKVAFESLIGV